MIEILPEIVSRRSVRKYSDADVTDEEIGALIQAAHLAPSGSNMQPWDFLVVRSPELRQKIAALDHDQKWMLSAPVFILCIGNEKYRGDGDMERVIRDSAIAATHLLLQAEHMGLATCWTGWYEQDAMRSLLGLDPGCYVIGVVTVGHGAEAPAPRPRRAPEYRVL